MEFEFRPWGKCEKIVEISDPRNPNFDTVFDFQTKSISSISRVK